MIDYLNKLLRPTMGWRVIFLLAIVFLLSFSPALAIAPVLSNTSTNASSQPSTMRHLLKTGDGTLHSFVQLGTNTTTCGSGGLWWMYSNNNGDSWACGSQLSSSTSPLMYADSRSDSSDNIYLVYSAAISGGNANYDVVYRKLTASSCSPAPCSWTVEAPQTVLDGDASGDNAGFHYATLELDGNSRAWVAAREYDGTNYQVGVYYSSDLTATPTWTVSQATLDVGGTSATYHYQTMVRYGSNIGIIYSIETSGDMAWRTRADSDGLTTWSSATTFCTTDCFIRFPTFSAAGDSAGNVYLSHGDNDVDFQHYFSSWSAAATVASTVISDQFTSVATDGTDVWVLYGDTTGITGGVNRKLAYKKGVAPFGAANFDSNPTLVADYHGNFDKVWLYDASANSYQDETADSGSIASADVAHSDSTRIVNDTGDIIYLGKSDKYDAINWVISTNSAGGTNNWEYCSAVDGSFVCDVWSTLPLTVSQNPGWKGNGYLSFTPPVDWVASKVNGEPTANYYTRDMTVSSYTTGPIGTQINTIPLPSWGNLAMSTAGVYAIWTENNSTPAKIRYTTLLSHNTSPDVPTSLSGEVLGLYTTDQTPTLSFTLSDPDITDTVKYRIQVDDNADFGSVTLDYISGLGIQGTASFTVGQDVGSGSYTVFGSGQTLADNDYYWRVKAIDDDAVESEYVAANSGSVAFRVDTTSPTTPGTPSSPSSISDSTPTWNWTASSDNGSGLANPAYTVEWSLVSDFTSGVSTTTVSTASFTHTTTLSDNTWYFRVKTVDALGNESAYSNSGVTTIDSQSPTVPGTPSTSSTATDTTPTWNWTGSTDGGSGLATAPYYLQWSMTSDFTSGVSTTTTVSASFTHVSPLTDGTWYFRVKSRDVAGNESSYSSAGTKLIDTVAPSVTGTPSTSSSITDTTPTWSWTGSSDGGSGLASTPYSLQWSKSNDFSSGVFVDTSVSNSFSHLSSLTSGTWYFRVKVTDLAGNESAYSDAGMTVIDTEVAADTELDTPSERSYTNQERPSFRWKVGPESITDLAKYILEIDNPTGSESDVNGDFTLDNIPVSRSSVYETEKYLIRYENFSDADTGNNYITLQTKTSGLWSTSELDGKLREGKVRWTVKAVDSAGNTINFSRELFVDKTNSRLSINSVNGSAYSSNGMKTSSRSLSITGRVKDILSGGNTNLKQDESGPRVASGPSQVEVRVERKESWNYSLFSLYSINSEKIYFECDGKEITDNSKQGCDKYFDFEYHPKKNLDLGDFRITVTGRDRAGNAVDEVRFDLNVTSLQNVLTVLEMKMVDEETKILKPKQKIEVEESLEITKPLDKNEDEKREDIVMESIKKSTESTVVYVLNVVKVVETGVHKIVNSVENVIAAVGGGIIHSGKVIGEHFNQVVNKTSGLPKIILGGIGNGFSKTVTTAESTLKGVIWVFDDMKHKTVVTKNNISDNLGNLIINFGSWFVVSPTKISNVKVVVMSPTSAKVSWVTNNPANGKVNYGTDRTYPHDVQSEDKVTNHEFILKDLKPNTVYYFEVMSFNKNYVYDAYREFKTPEE